MRAFLRVHDVRWRQRGARYCSNVKRIRSLANRMRQMPMRDAYAGDVPIIIEETQPAGAEDDPQMRRQLRRPQMRQQFRRPQMPGTRTQMCQCHHRLPRSRSPRPPSPRQRACSPMMPSSAGCVSSPPWWRMWPWDAAACQRRFGQGSGRPAVARPSPVKAPPVIQAACSRGRAADLPPCGLGPRAWDTRGRGRWPCCRCSRPDGR